MEKNTRSTKRATSAGQRVCVRRIRILMVALIAGGFVGVVDLPDATLRGVPCAHAQSPAKDPTTATAGDVKSQDLSTPRKPAGNSVKKAGVPREPDARRRTRDDKSKHPKAAAPVRNPIERSGNATTEVPDKQVGKPNDPASREAAERQSAVDALRKLQRQKQESEGAKAPVKNPIERTAESSADTTTSPQPPPTPAASPAPPTR